MRYHQISGTAERVCGYPGRKSQRLKNWRPTELSDWGLDIRFCSATQPLSCFTNCRAKDFTTGRSLPVQRLGQHRVEIIRRSEFGIFSPPFSIYIVGAQNIPQFAPRGHRLESPDLRREGERSRSHGNAVSRLGKRTRPVGQIFRRTGRTATRAARQPALGPAIEGFPAECDAEGGKENHHAAADQGPG